MHHIMHKLFDRSGRRSFFEIELRPYLALYRKKNLASQALFCRRLSVSRGAGLNPDLLMCSACCLQYLLQNRLLCHRIRHLLQRLFILVIGRLAGPGRWLPCKSFKLKERTMEKKKPNSVSKQGTKRRISSRGELGI